MPVEQLEDFVVHNLEEVKAVDVTTLDISNLSSFSDKMIVASATSARHCKAIAKQLLRAAKEAKRHVIGTEGLDSGEWVLVDLGDIVVHIMQPKVRDFYNLEKLWSTPTLVEATA